MLGLLLQFLLISSSFTISLCFRDYFEVLAVHRTASTSEIRKAFREKSLKYHPDKFVNSQGCKSKLEACTREASEKFTVLQTAKEVLIDPTLREIHITEIDAARWNPLNGYFYQNIYKTIKSWWNKPRNKTFGSVLIIALFAFINFHPLVTTPFAAFF